MSDRNRGGARCRNWIAAASAAVLAAPGCALEAAGTEQDEAVHIRGHVAGQWPSSRWSSSAGALSDHKS